MWKGPQLSSRWGGQSWARTSCSDRGVHGTPRPRERLCAVNLIHQNTQGTFWRLVLHPGLRRRLPQGLLPNLSFVTCLYISSWFSQGRSDSETAWDFHVDDTTDTSPSSLVWQRVKINPCCFGCVLDHRNLKKFRQLSGGNLHACFLVGALEVGFPRLWKRMSAFPQHSREASGLRPLYSSSRPMSITHFVSCPQQDLISSQPIATKEVSRPPSSSASPACAQGMQSKT